MELSFDFRWPWVLPVVVVVALLVVLAIALLARRRRRIRPNRDAVLVAHAARLRALPRYRTMAKARRTGGILATAFALLIVAGAGLAVARPQQTLVEEAESVDRDLVVCLDAAPVMDADNVRVVRAILELLDDLDGDRVALVLWTHKPVKVVGFSDDYGELRKQLVRATAAFSGNPDGWFAELGLRDRSAAPTGDGIAGCIDAFKNPPGRRPRAVLLSTDNIDRPAGDLTVAEAATYAVKREVQIFSLGGDRLASVEHEDARVELADASAATGGVFALVGSGGAADALLARISVLEDSGGGRPPRAVLRDIPGLAVVVAGGGVFGLLVVWLSAIPLPRREERGGARKGNPKEPRP